MKKHIFRTLIITALAVVGGSQQAAAVFAKDYYASQSALSRGRWVKIKVRESGMQQITDAELREMGFEHPDKVAVYGYGATCLSDYRLTSESPDDLPAVAVMRHGDKLVFYGEGDVSLKLVKRVSVNGAVSYPVEPVRNYYADYGTYFLTDAMPQVAPEKMVYDEAESEAVGSSWGMAHYEEELYNDGAIGARFLGRRFVDEPKQRYVFSMPGFIGDSRVCIQAVYGVRVDKSRVMPVTLPSGSRTNLSLSPVKAETYAYQGITQIYSDKPLKSDGDVYSMSIDATGAAAGGLDFVTVAYPRDNSVGDAPQSMLVFKALESKQKVELKGVKRNTRVWAVSDGRKPVRELEIGNVNGVRPVEPGMDAERYFVMSPGHYDVSRGEGCCYLLAFNPDDELRHVEFAGEVSNQNLHGFETPQMLIVTSRLMRGEAERLARAHKQADGLDAGVVLIDDIYNEFSSGTPHIMAIRRFARMLADRCPGRLRSVLLFGAAHWDNRGLTMEDEAAFRDNLIPIYLREDVAGCGKLPESYATDALAGMLEEDADGFDIGRSLMTVAVGRIPARSPGDAASAVSKIERWLQNPPAADLMNRAVLMCDKGDKNGHMADAEGLAEVISGCSPSTTVYKAYNTVYPISGRTAAELHRCAEWVLKKGAAYMAYSGHATPRDLAAELVWSTKKALATDYRYPTFVMLATCRALYYDHPEVNIGETLLYKDRGGAIGVVGALREVYQEYNQQLNLAMGDEFFSGRHGRTYGEVFRKARNRMVPTTPPSGAIHYYDLIYNSLSYNFIGDPEVAVPVAEKEVEILSVDGKAVGAGLEVESGRFMEVTGRVVSNDVTDTGFDGELTLSIFDGPVTRKTINHDSTSGVADVVMDEALIYEGKASVSRGRFSARVFVPTPDYPGGGNRMVAFAVSDDGEMATGHSGKIDIVDGSDGGSDGVAAPDITCMWIDDELFLDGDVTGGDVRFYAEVGADEAGVVCGSSQIGHKLALTLDEGHKLAEAEHCFVQGSNGGGVLDMEITGLADGNHELSLKVCNHAGVYATRSIRFTVVNTSAFGVLSVEERPAAQVATISLKHDFKETPRGRLVVRNGDGKVVFSDSGAEFPYIWNLTDASGAQVAEGRYEVEAYLHGGAAYGRSSAAEIVVSRD